MTDPQANVTSSSVGTTETIDFNEILEPNTTLLPAPEPTDDLETTTKKVCALASIIKQGKSLAIHTGYKAAVHEIQDPQKLAEQRMTPTELRQFTAWKQGATIPSIDWDTKTKTILGGPLSQKRFSKRALAMREIYNEPTLTAEHASWFTHNMVYALPLVNAVVKVHGAARDLVGNQEELTAVELAEMQTVRRVVAVARGNLERVRREMKLLSDRLKASSKTLQARESALRAKLASLKLNMDPVNHTRRFEGLPGPVVDFSDQTSGGRIPRSNSSDGVDDGVGIGTVRRPHKRLRRVAACEPLESTEKDRQDPATIPTKTEDTAHRPQSRGLADRLSPQLDHQVQPSGRTVS